MAPITRSKRKIVEKDRLSQLPDNLVLHLLSFLSMKDAARTSVLSKYWRKRWLYADFFDFDAYEVFKRPGTKYIPVRQSIPEHDSKYVEWVSQVLRAHREATDDDGNPLVLSKLRVHMRLIKQFQQEFDEWLSYAFTRRLQSLELHVIVSVGTMPSCSFSGRLPDGTDFNCLRSLSLTSVDVSGEVIESFLSKFPLLEQLKVCGSKTLESLTVCGSSLALKHLELSCCLHLKNLIVRGTSLVSLTMHWPTQLVLVDNPKLVALRTAEWIHPTRNILGQLSSCLSTVQILALDTTYEDNLEAIDEVPELSEVKQLTLIVDPLLDDSLIRLAALLSSSPKLEKLVLEFLYLKPYPKKCERKMVLSTVSTRFPAQQQRVKVVELRGYYGDVAEDEALMYVLYNSVAPPGRVIFDPWNRRRDFYSKNSYSRVTDKKRYAEEERVELLKRVLPPSVQLTVV